MQKNRFSEVEEVYSEEVSFQFSVPDKWYDGLYRDKTPCCSAARPFSLIHGEPAKECWLLIHGYRGFI